MSFKAIQQIEDIIVNHRSKGFKASFSGWRVHKYNHYSMKEEYVPSSNTKYYGMIHLTYMDVIPCSDNDFEENVECAGCRRYLSWSKSVPYSDYENARREHKNVIYFNETDNLLYCGKCILGRSPISEVRVRSNLDVDAFKHLQIKHVSCTSLSNVDEVMKYVRVHHHDNKIYLRGIATCTILPGAYIPFDLRIKHIAKRVLRKWRTNILQKKVAYVLYKCISQLDKETAIAFGKLAVK